MPLYSLREPVELTSPVIVAAFDGWVDGGRAGTMAAEQLADGGRLVASFDRDALYDYRARRPTLDIVDGKLIDLEWADLTLRSARLGQRDVLVLTGPEPDFRWQQLTADVVELTTRLGVAGWVSLGAIPATVAHTRPVPVLATASVAGLLPEDVKQGPPGHLRVPAALVSVLEHAVSREAIPAVGFFAQVPHYASGAFPNGAIELLRHVGRYLEADPPLGELPVKALETRALLDAAVAGEDRTREYVERLEQMADEAKLPSGDELIADIERFLRGRAEDGDGGDGEGRPN
ncbi:MAG TPA: PAC2 family protein [Candidatus Limnocylindria bacterium]|nr:PAC2 family protein [Candidatus Limnocylindria bacterium]